MRVCSRPAGVSAFAGSSVSVRNANRPSLTAGSPPKMAPVRSAAAVGHFQCKVELHRNQGQPIRQGHRRQVGGRPEVMRHKLQAGNLQPALMGQLGQQFARRGKVSQPSRAVWWYFRLVAGGSRRMLFSSAAAMTPRLSAAAGGPSKPPSPGKRRPARDCERSLPRQTPTARPSARCRVSGSDRPADRSGWRLFARESPSIAGRKGLSAQRILVGSASCR